MSGARDPGTLRTVAVLPARLGSRRLPRKMLLAETGRALIEHTAEAVARCPAIGRVVVATDSEEILAVLSTAGVDAVMTRADHASGTDRVQEAVERTGSGEVDVVLNVQGDEPEIDADDLARLVAAFADPGVRAATLGGPLAAGDADRPEVVKVVRDARGDALYFSRAALPFRATDGARAYARDGAPPWERVARRHVGVYAFRPDALARFCALPPGELEALENLEQLRWLEAGERMRVVDADHVPRGIDTREDYDEFVARARAARS